MGANLIKLNGNTILDLTGDTVTDADVRVGVTFHKRNGEAAKGTYIAPQSAQTQEKSIDVRKSGKYSVTPDSGYLLSGVSVNAQFSPNLQDKTVTTNGEVVADSGYDGLSKVTVNVASSGVTNDLFKKIVDRSITEVTAADLYGTTTIGASAFNSCKNLTSVVLPDTVVVIDGYSFNGCAFASIVIPDSVESIGNVVFANNDKLTSIIIGSGITTIGTSALSCKNLASITMRATTPPTIQANTFSTTYKAITKIAVPVGCGNAYKAATNWSTWADVIVEEEF